MGIYLGMYVDIKHNCVIYQLVNDFVLLIIVTQSNKSELPSFFRVANFGDKIATKGNPECLEMKD